MGSGSRSHAARPSARWRMDEAIGFLIYRVGKAMRAAVEERLAPYGVTAQQWAVLLRCYESGETTPNELASALALDTAAITRLLDRLETKGLVARRGNPTDRRSIIVEPTDAGRALAPRLIAIPQHTNREFLRDLSDEEVDQLAALLRRMLESQRS